MFYLVMLVGMVKFGCFNFDDDVIGVWFWIGECCNVWWFVEVFEVDGFYLNFLKLEG